LSVVLFWLLVSALGVVGIPFVELLLGRLPGRGLVFARPFSLVVTTFPLWLLATLHLVPYERLTTLMTLVAAATGAGLLWRRRGGPLVSANAMPIWLAGELVFTVTFACCALLRSFVPDVWQTEKPMDMALVNAINRSTAFPPHDPWQSGAHVNYYYYGHYLVAFLIRVSGVDPAVGYNLGVALFYALAASAVFGVGATFYQSAGGKRDTSRRSPVLVGLTATAFACVLGNLAGGFQLIHHPDRIGSYDWWAPSRVIAGTANEFPAFSFLLGDLHAHVMVTPFSLIVVAYALQLALRGPPAWRPGPGWAAVELVLAGLVLGVLYAVNSWDFPTGCAVGAGGLLLWVLADSRRRRQAVVWAVSWAMCAVLLFVPFWRDFSPPTKGIALVQHHTSLHDFMSGYLLIYGLPLGVTLLLFTGRFRFPPRYVFWSASVLLFALVLLAPPHLAGVAVALALVALAVFAMVAPGPLHEAERFLWLIAAVGLGLIAFSEIAYIRDLFDGTAEFRFNTVFKTGYQAWFLLSIVAGVTVHWRGSSLRPPVRTAWLTVLAGLSALALVYPVLGAYSRTQHFAHRPTLDGMAWLERSSPGDAAAISWLRRSVHGSPTLLEDVGNDFDAAGRGRVSTFTGLPAVAEWPEHEKQWGHDPGRRDADARLIYRTRDIATARRLLARYQVRYVFVGSLERQDYSPPELAKFSRLGTAVFRSEGTVVYRI
jgi:YYY domain-containing protein